MKLEKVMTYAATPAEVYAMVVSPQFQERKCADADALSWDVSITGDDGATVVRTKRKLPTVGFPSVLRKFVPSGVTSTETITWGSAGSDGARTGDLHVDFHGAPARMNGTVRIVPDGAGATTVHIDAEFKALVPVIGGKVEKLAAPIIVAVMESEERTGQAWTAHAA